MSHRLGRYRPLAQLWLISSYFKCVCSFHIFQINFCLKKNIFVCQFLSRRIIDLEKITLDNHFFKFASCISAFLRVFVRIAEMFQPSGLESHRERPSWIVDHCLHFTRSLLWSVQRLSESEFFR
ncbi:unnamed protein product [Oikopleura dioica]|uniref:Uncharacterized protein n=1 Tax=Oikopleura dioica TaxID=34765 RepID=E4XZV4_OIKDI|nr:unnamed protein product [Oikopleura dioica]